jgi:hypothetical protein
MDTYPEIMREIFEDFKASGINQIPLVDVISTYDGRNKLAPLPEEVNEALKTIDWLVTVKKGKEVFFEISSNQIARTEIKREEFLWASKEYTKRFWKAYKKVKDKAV